MEIEELNASSVTAKLSGNKNLPKLQQQKNLAPIFVQLHQFNSDYLTYISMKYLTRFKNGQI
jgi:hypothetical protein